MKYLLPTLFFAWVACLPIQAQDTLIPFAKNGKWGYCNAQKKIVIPCIYSSASFFVGNLARVSDTTRSNYWGFGNYGYINRKGEVVIPLKFAWAHDFHEGWAYVELSQKTGIMGALIDQKGNFVLPPKIQIMAIPLPITEAPVFREDLMRLRINLTKKTFGKSVYGYYNRAGKQVFKGNFTYANHFSNGLALVYSTYKDNYKSYFINKKGKVALHSVYDKVDNFSEGLAGVCKGGKCGFIDKTGKPVIPFEYDSVGRFREGLAVVVKAGKMGFINPAGKVVIPLVYDAVCDFSEGLAAVSQHNKVGFINQAGEIVIPLSYDVGQQMLFLSQELVFKGGLVIMKHQDREGAINRTGKVVIPFRYISLEDMYEPTQGFATNFMLARSEDQQDFYIDKKGVEYRE